jgi:hypothetical protein
VRELLRTWWAASRLGAPPEEGEEGAELAPFVCLRVAEDIPAACDLDHIPAGPAE